MSAPSGFANADVLFAHVLPRAGRASTDAVASAAQEVSLPAGSLITAAACRPGRRQ
jgi:hypothetical protein